VSPTSRAGFKHAGGNLVRVAVLLGSLATLVLARGNAPIEVLITLVAVFVACLYLVDRKSGRVGLWAAYLVGFVLFALLRSIADETGIPVRAEYAVDAERTLFGGTLPTDWLLQRLYDAGSNSILDVFVVAMIFSYYLVPHLVALGLWRRNVAAFGRYGAAVLLTVYVGLVVSFVVPTAPPWLADRYSDAPSIDRVSADVLNWNAESVGPGSVTAGTNPFAAMPSLHFALTALIVLALWRHRVLKVLALAYAAAMAFALVYGGEHYVVDELAGAATAALAWVAVKNVRLARTAPAGARSPAVSTVASPSTAD
jgi:membrane-associated phospholipid phosphatase